ncbi:MAG TPA: 16S rRNA (adenine(1518)-N(6)/adenine(1519)-N(6))-dimethyltransferase RsmA [Candidatus Aphodovivens avistercoris]|nr:16S rRNA (adenine(1518)-N(6)/adenine(1519)-N(6))-dimethyltransferase RsmA [Candidatus Aphodovivens avistercoris]
MGKLSPLASVAATREVLQAHGLATKKAFGQNFLINDDVLAKIIDLAQVQGSDRVLEVGPGIGTLTIALLKHAGRVVSVERDADLPAVLAETCAPWADRFALIGKDALELSADELRAAFAGLAGLEAEAQRAAGAPADCADAPMPNKFVANLPYAVAATIVLDFFERFPSLQSATVMVQKEVADRMAAEPGTKNYGAYTVKLRLHAQPTGRFAVGPGNFFPPPHVDSAVIRLDRRTPDEVTAAARALAAEGVLLGCVGGPDADDPAAGEAAGAAERALVRATCLMADAAFATRRKTLANSCKTFFAGRGAAGKRCAEQLPCLFEGAGVDPKRRGESLSLGEFVSLGATYLRLTCAEGC